VKVGWTFAPPLYFLYVQLGGPLPNSLLQSATSIDSQSWQEKIHFEAFWLRFDGFQQTVHQDWGYVQTKPCPLETLALKFKATVHALRSWRDKRIGNFRLQLELAKEILHQLEIAQDNRPLSILEVWLCNSLKKHSLVLTSLLWTVTRLRS
jgi:hypothetical protein